ncbi:hypothetical protein MHU86_8433 [Fragilaria crotonensis]|nr:hypothetical protein MHU86_8433 [Fragilaria crotonensis]
MTSVDVTDAVVVNSQEVEEIPQKLSVSARKGWFDRFLVQYNKFVSSSANQDKGLKFVQWTLWLLSRLHPGKKQALLKCSFDVSFARYLLRFYGMPSALEAVRNSSWEDSTSSWGKTTGKLMAWSMLVYYPLEHVAYLKWTSPELLPSSLNANRFSAYSCRFWLLYLVAELVQGSVRLRRLYHERTLQEDGREEVQVSIASEQIQMLRSALFTLPCLHWSLPNWDTDPWLSDGMCNGINWVESVVSLYQAIRAHCLANCR